MKTLNGMKTGALMALAFSLALGGFAARAQAEIGLKTNADIKIDMGRGPDRRDGRRDDRREKMEDWNDKREDRTGARVMVGTVIGVSGTNISIKSDKDGAQYNVVAANAKISIGNSLKAVSDIKIGDTLIIDGTISGSSITATRILATDSGKNIPENGDWKNMKSGISGTVTASSLTTLTVAGKNGTTYTVDVSNSTFQKERGAAINLSDIKVGDAVLIQGTINGTSVKASNVYDVEATAQAIEDRKDNGNHYGFFHRLGLWFGGIFKAKTSASVNLNGSTFRLASYNGTEIPAGQNYLLSFNDGRLGIKFCNSMGGDYSLSKGTIKGQLVSTMMFCSEPANVMTYESAFGKILGEGAKLTQSGSRLTIKGNAGETFVFNVFMD